MNTHNPLVPQGSMLEQKAKGKPHLRIAIFIVAIHVVFLGGLLIQGCKKEEPKVAANNPLTPDSTRQPDTSQPGLTPPPGIGIDPYATSPIAPQSALPLSSTSGLPITPSAPGLPETAPALGATPVTGPTEHVVIKGDTFGTLAKKYGVSVKAIAAANPGVDSTKLKLKQKLAIPAPAPKADTTAATTTGAAPAGAIDIPAAGAEKSYKVKPNDNLHKIARAHGVTVRELQAANNLKTTQIKAGEKLVIPAPKGKVATAETAALSAPAPAPLILPPTTSTPSLPSPGSLGAPAPGRPSTNR